MSEGEVDMFCVTRYVIAASMMAAGAYPALAEAEIGRTVIEAGVAFHEVARGETVFRVARDYGLKMEQVIAENDLVPPFTLRIGQHLALPIVRSYKVVDGDTLFSISQDHGVAVASMSALNGVGAPYTIRPGQWLSIPPARTRAGAVSTTVATGSTPVSGTVALPPAQLPPPPATGNDGYIWPVEGRVISAFGRKSDGRRNDGVNIAAPRGAPVRAAQAGVVAYADNGIAGLGNLLLIKHRGGVITAYAHNEAQLVARGDVVARGQVIARIGSTGRVETPQLHFEIRKSGTAVDPRSFLATR